MSSSGDEDDDKVENGYLLEDADIALLTLVGGLLERAMLTPGIEWAVKVSLAKLLHVICRLPNPSAELNLDVTFSSPRERYGDEEVYFSLSVGVEDDLLKVRYGGYYYHSRSGGDSFSVFAWSARPGADADWIDHSHSLDIVTALVEPIDVLHAMADALKRCDIHVSDEENPLVNDEPAIEPLLFMAPGIASSDEAEASEEPSVKEPSDAEDDEASGPLVIKPVTAADHRLLKGVGPGNIYATSAGSAYGIEDCDGCRVDLATVGLFVDGSSPRGEWGNYCASCCFSHGVAVGWGKGQLYAHQPDGSWKGIAGFQR